MPEEEGGTGTSKNPVLLKHKPAKVQVKKAKASPHHTAMDPSSGSTTTGTTASTPPPAPKRTLLRRMVPLLLVANLAVGAYVFLRTYDKKPTEESEHEEEAPATRQEERPAKPSLPASVKVLPPIPEDEQRELFKWILEEKRKMKATSPLEKKKLDQEKDLLKQYIRAKSFPSI